MKKYLVTVRREQVTSMMVNGKNLKEAISKVRELISNCDDTKVSLDKIFDKGSHFRYKAILVDNNKI